MKVIALLQEAVAAKPGSNVKWPVSRYSEEMSTLLGPWLPSTSGRVTERSAAVRVTFWFGTGDSLGTSRRCCNRHMKPSDYRTIRPRTQVPRMTRVATSEPCGCKNALRGWRGRRREFNTDSVSSALWPHGMTTLPDQVRETGPAVTCPRYTAA